MIRYRHSNPFLGPAFAAAGYGRAAHEAAGAEAQMEHQKRMQETQMWAGAGQSFGSQFGGAFRQGVGQQGAMDRLITGGAQVLERTIAGMTGMTSSQLEAVGREVYEPWEIQQTQQRQTQASAPWTLQEGEMGPLGPRPQVFKAEMPRTIEQAATEAKLTVPEFARKLGTETVMERRRQQEVEQAGNIAFARRTAYEGEKRGSENYDLVLANRDQPIPGFPKEAVKRLRNTREAIDRQLAENNITTEHAAGLYREHRRKGVRQAAGWHRTPPPKPLDLKSRIDQGSMLNMPVYPGGPPSSTWVDYSGGKPVVINAKDPQAEVKEKALEYRQKVNEDAIEYATETDAATGSKRINRDLLEEYTRLRTAPALIPGGGAPGRAAAAPIGGGGRPMPMGQPLQAPPQAGGVGLPGQPMQGAPTDSDIRYGELTVTESGITGYPVFIKGQPTPFVAPVHPGTGKPMRNVLVNPLTGVHIALEDGKPVFDDRVYDAPKQPKTGLLADMDSGAFQRAFRSLSTDMGGRDWTSDPKAWKWSEDLGEKLPPYKPAKVGNVIKRMETIEKERLDMQERQRAAAKKLREAQQKQQEAAAIMAPQAQQQMDAEAMGLGGPAAPSRGMTGELGVLRRPGGGVSTEITVGVQDGRINDGRQTNIPLLVRGQVGVDDLLVGKKPTRKQTGIAIDRYLERGGNAPSFDTVAQGDAAGQARSARLSVLPLPAKQNELVNGRLYRLTDGRIGRWNAAKKKFVGGD